MRLALRFLLALFSIGVATAPAAFAQEANQPTMYMLRYIEVAPGAENQGISLLKQLADASHKDAGTVRFEILQRIAPATHFVIFEVWKDKGALDAHMAAAHSKTFSDAVQPLLIAPVDDRPCIAADAGPLMPASGEARYVITHVDFGPPSRDAGLALLKTATGAGRKDSGNLGFDALQQTARNNHFEVVEIWKDQKASDASEMTPATKEFRAKVAPLLGAHYDRRWYKAL
jgi:quinol monooxygenase YgiN